MSLKSAAPPIPAPPSAHRHDDDIGHEGRGDRARAMASVGARFTRLRLHDSITFGIKGSIDLFIDHELKPGKASTSGLRVVKAITLTERGYLVELDPAEEKAGEHFEPEYLVPECNVSFAVPERVALVP